MQHAIPTAVLQVWRLFKVTHIKKLRTQRKKAKNVTQAPNQQDFEYLPQLGG